ncbi:uncharacterized protein LOC105772228 [Gossypium raimondii]|uniref:FAF domain-containing protein n=2 Tax=Gossypium raimondii TaxID=29730 RepID=A0A0D2U8V7_GOSRA|nr:uncharacterized protein LOC105772228 [Gossypium raimondii]KJB64356.1 hypothetical protein B456_010G044800 [Gossypium raimondii]
MQFGIEALTICPKKNQTEKHCNFCMMTSSFVSESAASWVIGDYIGMESCFDLYNNDQVCSGGGGGDGGRVFRESRVKRGQRCRKEFPPPIPSLARTENQPPHMPWVLQRYYTNDGRLILREEKVKHHEYFRAHRSNGRLTLHLIPLDNEDNDTDVEEEEAKEEDDQGNVVVETSIKDNNESEESMVKCPVGDNNDNGIAANGGKCMNYSSVRTSPTCFLGLPAIRPVHS